MKFVKDNLTLVICGAVIVLVAVFAFAPIPFAAPSLRESLQKEMKERYDHRNSIKSSANTTLTLPGWPEAKGIPPLSWVKAKYDLIKGIHDQQKEVEKAAHTLNAAHRLEGNSPLLPVPPQDLTDPARITGVKMDGYLPRVTQDAMAFKAAYGKQFPLWTGLLTKGKATPVELDSATPPNAAKLKDDFDNSRRAAAAGLPAGLTGNPGGATGQDQRELWDYEKRFVMSQASSLRMYIEPSALQVRQWYFGNEAPTDQQIFEAIVDSWFQSDVVKAIAAVNIQSLNSVPEKDRNVGRAGIKRLTRIIIGNAARTRQLGGATGTVTAAAPGTAIDPGPLFFTSSNANSVGGGGAISLVPVNPGGGGAPAEAAPPTPNNIDYALGMTGRSAGDEYDVVQMSVILDMDPAYLFKFMDQMYRQNMGYTITNWQFKTVDPLDRASNGYLYGDVQVIEVEFQMEGILFRSWTVPLMPKDVRATLGITTPVK